MTAEFQVPSALVPTRESHFIRYCKHHVDGTWAVVDVSLDKVQSNPPLRCRRRPSGCVIQKLSNGYSKVIWVEHVEVDDKGVHNIYKPLINSGVAFGAKRWVTVLNRQCERLTSVMAINLPTNEVNNMVLTNPEGRKSILKLAARMVTNYCCGVNASNAHTWTALSGNGADDIRIMTRKSDDDPGKPCGIVLCAATSLWLPVPPKTVFDFLSGDNSRSEWDILSNGGITHEMAHIATGKDKGNCISLLQSSNSSQSNMIILQESCNDPTGSYVIYAPVDIVGMNMVLGGGDPEYVPLLPSGFAILPDGPTGHGGGGGMAEASSGGSLLTVAFQVLVETVPTAKLRLGSVANVSKLITSTVDKIKAALVS
ncbi:Homeobox-leucine zipper protein HDG2 [Forsythia ovata]|uniref:Homeobox-leucine zipper protein HDG2 n=1 Tax=Forsythia ovata TaxID=205694 RepID=A0ABD1R137_9LAMI